MDGWKGWISRWMDGWVSGWMGEWVDGWVSGCVGRMDGGHTGIPVLGTHWAQH